MEPRLLELLPPPVNRMVAEIEKMTGSEIAVRPREPGDPEIPGGGHLATLDCWMDQGTMRVTLICPTAQPAPIHTVIHEILHAWRNIVLPVVRLEAADDNDFDARTWAAIVENDIEHLFIVPLEIRFAPEAATYWNFCYQQTAEELQQILAFQKRFNKDNQSSLEDLMRHWLVTSAIPQLDCRATLRAMLEQYGCLAPAERLVAEVWGVLPDKARMVSLALSHFRRPRDRYCLAQFDVPGRQIKFGRIPE